MTDTMMKNIRKTAVRSTVNKKIPLRQCVGCREMKDKRQMLRVLKTSEGDITIDMTGRRNGRGAYLCFSMECMEKARKSRGLERSLKTAISADVYENLEKELMEFASE